MDMIDVVWRQWRISVAMLVVGFWLVVVGTVLTIVFYTSPMWTFLLCGPLPTTIGAILYYLGDHRCKVIRGWIARYQQLREESTDGPGA